MRMQLLVTFLLMTLMLAGLTGHAAENCNSAIGVARVICQQLAIETRAPRSHWEALGAELERVDEMRATLNAAYKYSQQPNANSEHLFELYRAYQAAKTGVTGASMGQISRQFGKPESADLNYSSANEERARIINDAIAAEQTRLRDSRQPETSWQAEIRRTEEARQAADLRRAEEQRQISGRDADQGADQARAAAMKAQSEAQRADREMMDQYSQIPRCYSAGFAVNTAERDQTRCERIKDRAGMLKALGMTEAKGLEQLNSCGSNQMMCNPLVFGAVKVSDRVQPICVAAGQKASDDCDRKSTAAHKAWLKTTLQDQKNLEALHRLHGNLNNSCGLTSEQQSRGVTMNHVVSAGRALSAEAKARRDNAGFIRTCQRLYGITTGLTGANPLPVARPIGPTASARQ